MKIRFLILATLFMAVLSFSSCNKKEEEMSIESTWSLYYAHWCHAFNSNVINRDAFPYANSHLIFCEESEWDEVEYEISNPSNYKIIHFETINYNQEEEGDNFILLRDSVEIGKVYLYSNGKVIFQDKNTSERKLLYDFGYICNSSIGAYIPHLTSGNNFMYFSELQTVPTESMYRYLINNQTVGFPFIKNSYGGLTIAMFGSTTGFLSPINNTINNYRREILQAYRYIEFDNTRFSGIDTFYKNRNSVVEPFLPVSFWVDNL